MLGEESSAGYSDAVMRVFESALANLKSRVPQSVFEVLEQALHVGNLHEANLIVGEIEKRLIAEIDYAD